MMCWISPRSKRAGWISIRTPSTSVSI
jgi:hypothetical protein